MDRILSSFKPISLDEMSGIKLMNRTDTKFVTTVDRLRLLLELAQKDYRAQEINGKRIASYYTAYFDTPDNNMYIVHQNGHAGRQKLRIRSYIESGMNFLEVKTKNNHGRTKKKRVDMVGFDPNNPDHGIRFLRQDDQYRQYDEFLRKHLRYDPTVLTEHLENHFNRITLVNNGHHRAQARRPAAVTGPGDAARAAHQAERIQQVLHGVGVDQPRLEAQ